MKNRIYYFFMVLGACTFALYCMYLSKNKASSDYTKIQVKFHPSSLINPYFFLEIQGRTHIVSLDLGLGLPLSLCENKLKRIQNKEEFATISMQGTKCIPVPCRVYKLPYIQIGKYAVANVLTMQETIELRKTLYKQDVPIELILENEKNSQKFRDGSVGWNFFLHKNLMLDLGQRQCMYILEDLSQSSLSKKYDLSSFTKAPFTLSKTGIIFTIETDLGLKRFMLDNGSVSSIRSSLLENREDLIKEATYIYYRTPISINGTRFGLKEFLLSPINEQLEIDGILGYDFCLQPIYLDFRNQIAYIKKTDFPQDYRPKPQGKFLEKLFFILDLN